MLFTSFLKLSVFFLLLLLDLKPLLSSDPILKLQLFLFPLHFLLLIHHLYKFIVPNFKILGRDRRIIKSFFSDNKLLLFTHLQILLPLLDLSLFLLLLLRFCDVIKLIQFLPQRLYNIKYNSSVLILCDYLVSNILEQNKIIIFNIIWVFKKQLWLSLWISLWKLYTQNYA